MVELSAKYRAFGDREDQRGFTLVEMMVTVSIGAILLAMALNAYSSLRESTRVESAKEHVVSVLQQARLRALSTGGDQVVAFDWPANSVTFQGQTTTFELVNLKGFRCTGSVANDANTDNSFTFKNRGNVTFQGSPVTGGGNPPQNLQISSGNSSAAFVIKINDVTGRVAVVPGLSC